MKKLLYIIAILFLFSCEKEEVKAVLKTDIVLPSIMSPSTGFSKEITESDTSDNIVFKWSPADYGVNTIVTYRLLIAPEGKINTAVSVGTTSRDSISMTLGELNRLMLNNLNLPANESSNLEFKVVASLNSPDTLVDHNDEVSSAVSKIAITTYKKIQPPVETANKLWVPGAYQGWSPADAPNIYQVGEGLYEGYVYMNVGDYYKFTNHGDWDHINYGSAGDGKLSMDGLAEGLKVDEPGYYKFNVDTKNLTYSAILINTWGMIGTATAGSWDTSTPLTFDEVSGTWTQTLDLQPGALKFRANDGWDINYGPADINALTGTLIGTDAAIDIKEAGNYTVTVNLSKSAEPHEYKYEVVKNN